MDRLKNLAGWSLTMDKRWFVRTTVGWMVTMLLMFLFFTCVVNLNRVESSTTYGGCIVIVVCMLTAILVIGPAMTPKWGRHDDLRLMMVPASNLEKYLVRYSYWIHLLPCFLCAFFVADVMQYLVNVILGHKGAMLVIQAAIDRLAGPYHHTDAPRALYVGIFLTLVWEHSLFALGASLFRSHKWAWVLTILAQIIVSTVLTALIPHDRIAMHIDEHTAVSMLRLSNVVLVGLIVFDFWLSYRLFCRRQLIGRFINI